MNEWDEHYKNITKLQQEIDAERDEVVGLWTGYAVFLLAVLATVVWVAA